MTRPEPFFNAFAWRSKLLPIVFSGLFVLVGNTYAQDASNAAVQGVITYIDKVDEQSSPEFVDFVVNWAKDYARNNSAPTDTDAIRELETHLAELVKSQPAKVTKRISAATRILGGLPKPWGSQFASPKLRDETRTALNQGFLNAKQASNAQLAADMASALMNSDGLYRSAMILKLAMIAAKSSESLTYKADLQRFINDLKAAQDFKETAYDPFIFYSLGLAHLAEAMSDSENTTKLPLALQSEAVRSLGKSTDQFKNLISNVNDRTLYGFVYTQKLQADALFHIAVNDWLQGKNEAAQSKLQDIVDHPYLSDTVPPNQFIDHVDLDRPLQAPQIGLR